MPVPVHFSEVARFAPLRSLTFEQLLASASLVSDLYSQSFDRLPDAEMSDSDARYYRSLKARLDAIDAECDRRAALAERSAVDGA